MSCFPYFRGSWKKMSLIHWIQLYSIHSLIRFQIWLTSQSIVSSNLWVSDWSIENSIKKTYKDLLIHICCMFFSSHSVTAYRIVFALVVWLICLTSFSSRYHSKRRGEMKSMYAISLQILIIRNACNSNRNSISSSILCRQWHTVVDKCIVCGSKCSNWKQNVSHNITTNSYCQSLLYHFATRIYLLTHYLYGFFFLLSLSFLFLFSVFKVFYIKYVFFIFLNWR